MPMLGSRGGGSVRGFGRFGRILLLSLIDSFNRSTSGSLGTSSDGKGVWKNVTGTWQGNGSAAASLSLPGSRNVAVVDLDGTNITNLQVDTGTNGGSGLSFWVTDANNYYSLYPSYSSSSTSVTNCDTYRENSGYQNSTGMCVNNGDRSRINNAICYEYMDYSTFPSGVAVGYQPMGGLYMGRFQYDSNQFVFQACWAIGKTAYDTGQCCTPVTVGLQNSTVVTTTYNSTLNLDRTVGGSTSALVSSNYVSNTSGFSKTQSIAVSTSGNTISYTLYSGTNKGGSTRASGTNTPSSPVKGPGVGLFHGVSSVDQGSTLSNFSATVTP
jgi:hypothetical protein